jgi:hypothetical protein
MRLASSTRTKGAVTTAFRIASAVAKRLPSMATTRGQQRPRNPAKTLFYAGFKPCAATENRSRAHSIPAARSRKLRAVRPAVMATVARVLEAILAEVAAQARLGGTLDMRLVRWAFVIGREYARALLRFRYLARSTFAARSSTISGARQDPTGSGPRSSQVLRVRRRVASSRSTESSSAIPRMPRIRLIASSASHF